MEKDFWLNVAVVLILIFAFWFILKWRYDKGNASLQQTQWDHDCHRAYWDLRIRLVRVKDLDVVNAIESEVDDWYLRYAGRAKKDMLESCFEELNKDILNKRRSLHSNNSLVDRP